MRALLSRACGGPESLRVEEVPVPEPGAGEVRIAVRACALNYPDLLMIEDRYQFRPQRPFAPGIEVAGVVDALGPGVTGLSRGMPVMASMSHGGLAEATIAQAAKCVPIPEGMPFDEAAAFSVTYGTAYHALKDKGRLEAGETLLVLGASGGVGLAAVELGRALGANVVAAVSSEEKAEIARRHGAARTLIYPRTSPEPKALAAMMKEACPGGANVVFDPVGGAYAEPALRALTWEGRYLVIGFVAGIPSPPLNLVLLKSCSIVGVFWGSWIERCPEGHGRNTEALFSLYRSGAIRPLVSNRFPLERAAEAMRLLADRGAVGKIVVVL